MNTQPTTLIEPDCRRSAQRSQLYQIFSAAFAYPHHEAKGYPIANGGFEDIVHAVHALLPGPASAASPQPMAIFTLGDLQLRYTALFEVGNQHRNISLHESAFVATPKAKLWEDIIRFYEYFGLSYDGKTMRHWPDHLVVQLECLHYLSFLETGLAGDKTPLLRAQHDFIERHLLSWLPKLEKELAGVEDAQPYAGLTGLLIAYLTADRVCLGQMLGHAPAA